MDALFVLEIVKTVSGLLSLCQSVNEAFYVPLYTRDISRFIMKENVIVI